jgi:copper chaperone CopZ
VSDTDLVDAELQVTGMHCGSCVALIEESLADVPGVAGARVDLEAGRAFVTFDAAQTTLDGLCGIVAELGYPAAPAAPAAGAAAPGTPAAGGPPPAAG